MLAAIGSSAMVRVPVRRDRANTRGTNVFRIVIPTCFRGYGGVGYRVAMRS